MDYAIRPFRESDLEPIAALTLAAIRVTGLRAYAPQQVAAWSARYSQDRLLAGAARGDLILVAAGADEVPVAYTVLKANGHLDMLYCHPDHTGRGLALRLLTAAEEHAASRGVSRLFAEASELARPVFEKAGYGLLHRRDFALDFLGTEVPIHNYAMEKAIGVRDPLQAGARLKLK